jgi:hypothetical protein
MTLVTRECANGCGRSFVVPPRAINKIYCSKRCAWNANKRQQAMRSSTQTRIGLYRRFVEAWDLWIESPDESVREAASDAMDALREELRRADR